MTQHDKARPIEAGCLAMIVNFRFAPELNTKIFTVVRFSPAESNDPEIDGWLIDLEDAGNASGYALLEEKYLLRIDDPSIKNQIETERELVNS